MFRKTQKTASMEDRRTLALLFYRSLIRNIVCHQMYVCFFLEYFEYLLKNMY